MNLTYPDATGTTSATSINSGGSDIIPGSFTIARITALGTTNSTVTVASTDTINDVLTKIQNALADGTTATIDPTSGVITVTPGSGTLSFAGTTSDSTNFLTVAGFTGSGPYTSVPLIDNSKVNINPGDTSSNTYALSSYSIGTDGSVTATYANGDKITVTGDSNRTLLYTTAKGVQIQSANITNSVINPSQLQLQMSNVLNPDGLVSSGGNMFTLGPNAGMQTFAIGGNAGMGTINSGELESSNVDLTTELANLIIAQRSIDANSKTFSAENTIMRELVNLGN